MRRLVHAEPPLDFRDLSRSQWSHYVESRVNHQHEPRASLKPRRVKRGEVPMQRQEDALLLYLRTHGH